jgi:hypothetical protein
LKTKFNSVGLFWEDKPELPKVAPARFWEEPGYLPKFGELAFKPQLLTREDMIKAIMERERFVVDCEVFENYFLVAFMSIATGKIYYFEITPNGGFDLNSLRWMLQNFLTVGFNSNEFDLTMLYLVLAGLDTHQLKHSANRLIALQEKPWMVLRSYNVKRFKVDHIDLIEVAPLMASLKIYGGRLHVPRIQDLPFKHDTVLTREQAEVVRNYCISSDLVATACLYKELEEQVKLRERMSEQYGVDLRSKSDAQVAEHVIIHEYQRINYIQPQRRVIPEGTVFKYKIPHFFNQNSFRTPLMQDVLDTIKDCKFVVGEGGSIQTPPELANLNLQIANATYKMGIGGLHSSEERSVHKADAQTLLIDRDVASYYPAVMLNLKLFPEHLGPSFLTIYKSLVDRRIDAKNKSSDKTLSEVERARWKMEADSLKISINGIFGKTGNKYSVVYAPDMLTQITITGQLCLLMLVERAELAGITVASANTDGVIFKCSPAEKPILDGILATWEHETGFKTEETLYSAVYCANVNNYIAVKTDGKCKTKGYYSERGSALNSVLSKNPETLICSDAVQAFLAKGVPVATTIRTCKDVRRFVSVRTVKGGAVKDDVYLGKAIRWYYAKDQEGPIICARDGSKVPKSDGAKPLMDLPAKLPEDIDFAYYEQLCEEMLIDLGHHDAKVELNFS